MADNERRKISLAFFKYHVFQSFRVILKVFFVRGRIVGAKRAYRRLTQSRRGEILMARV